MSLQKMIPRRALIAMPVIAGIALMVVFGVPEFSRGAVPASSIGARDRIDDIPDSGGARMQRRDVVAFVSDTQEPIWLETFRLRRDRNEEATEAIFRAIARDTRIGTLFLLGDITAMGPLGWERIDECFSLLHNAGIGTHAVPGNHEYYVLPSLGLKAFQRRFPGSDPTWQLVREGGIAVMLLNSNISHLSTAEREKQQQWYESTLRTLQSDSTVRFVIVGTHHAPFTNSTIVDPSDEVRSRFVPPFFHCSKCVLFLSGHAHAFEHFRVRGRDFLVIGGGGGLLHPLLRHEQARYRDLFPFNAERRMFHYLLCEQVGDDLRLRVKMIRANFSAFESVYRFSISGRTARRVSN